MNADAALDALRLANTRYEGGDDEGALKFAEKALRLDESLEQARKLVETLRKFGPGSEMKAAVDRILKASGA
eukprot:scaffold38343_cov26-Tisochrysis_lutea.AAC.1